MKNNNSGKGIGFSGLLGLVFIVLKLTGVISWKWLWVLSPFWITAGLIVILLAVGLILTWIGNHM